MNIGRKIRQLRDAKKMTQEELADSLGISQPTLHNIESGNPQKIDFLLMDKVCKFFDKDFSYFTDDSVYNNKIKVNKGQIGSDNVMINHNYPESILTEIQNLINENKALKVKIAELENNKQTFNS